MRDLERVSLQHLITPVQFVDWIYLAQDRDQWWALVKTVTSLQVP
jgi:hypothetical protein